MAKKILFSPVSAAAVAYAVLRCQQLGPKLSYEKTDEVYGYNPGSTEEYFKRFGEEAMKHKKLRTDKPWDKRGW